MPPRQQKTLKAYPIIVLLLFSNDSDGEASLLNSVIDLTAIEGKVNNMIDYQNKADEANRLKEEMNEQKTKLAKEIFTDIKQIRDLLKVPTLMISKNLVPGDLLSMK